MPHRRAFTSLQEARELGVAADEVLKTVALWTERRYALAVVPASRRLDLRLVRDALEDPAARLATEAEVLDHETVLSAAGTETESIRVVTGELFRTSRQPWCSRRPRAGRRPGPRPGRR